MKPIGGRLPHLALLVFLQVLPLIMAQEPRLIIQPDSQISKSLGETVYVSCRAEVSDPKLVTEMRWTGPGGAEVPNYDRTIEIIEDGPGSLGLYIEKLKEGDTGTYNCSAVYAGNQNLHSSIQVLSFVKIDFGDTPTHQTPIVGSDALIKCTVTSSPSPFIDWLKDGRPLKTDEQHIIQQDGVLVRSISEDDEGVYRCRARVAQLGALDSRDIQVEVYVPPKIITRPQDTSGVEKEAVTFQCIAEGKPAPKYSWVDDESMPLGGQEGYFVDEVKGELTVLDLTPDQAGTYRCTASNPAGDDVAEAKLRVLTKPKLEQFLNITVDVDGNAEFRCVFSGDPKPNIIFQKETSAEPFYDGINSDARIEVVQTEDDYGNSVGIMKIGAVKRTDDGLYTCTGSSGGGDTIGWGHITVQFAPTFEQQPTDEFWSWEQEKVNLTCVATSIPNATIQWYIRNEEIPQRDHNLRVLALGPTGVLQVTPLDNSYFGTYTCQATNELGVVNHDVTLKQVHKPGPISHAKVDKITATTVTWSILEPHDNGGRPITVFLVQYKLRDLSWEDSQSASWTKGSSYTLERLRPQEHYVFRFAAKNEVGISEWSGEIMQQMPEVTVPEEPLIFVNDEGVNFVPYTDHYDLQWKTPQDNGDPIDYFTIIYYQVVKDGDGWKTLGAKIEKTVEFPGVTTYQIQKLRPDTHYRIELRAHNSIGYSSPAELVIKTANDPNAPVSDGSAGTASNHFSNEATGPPAGNPYTEPTLGIGIVIAIVVVGVLVLLIVLDISCFFCRDAGVTASLVRAVANKEKDKEAMLHNGKNNSDETLNPKGKVRSVGHISCDGNPHILIITNPLDTNGFSKGSDNSPLDSQEKDKDPTETTPMIDGKVNALPDVINVSKQARIKEVRTAHAASTQALNDSRSNLNKSRVNFKEEFVYQKKSREHLENIPPAVPTSEMLAWNREDRPISMTLMRTGESKEFFKSLNDITEESNYDNFSEQNRNLSNMEQRRRLVQSQGNLDKLGNSRRKSILGRPNGPPPPVPLKTFKKAPPPVPTRDRTTQLSTRNLAVGQENTREIIPSSAGITSHSQPFRREAASADALRSSANIFDRNFELHKNTNNPNFNSVPGASSVGYSSDGSSSIYAGHGNIVEQINVAHQIAPYQEFKQGQNLHKVVEEVRSTDSDMYQIVDFAPRLTEEAERVRFQQSPRQTYTKPPNLNDVKIVNQHFDLPQSRYRPPSRPFRDSPLPAKSHFGARNMAYSMHNLNAVNMVPPVSQSYRYQRDEVRPEARPVTRQMSSARSMGNLLSSGHHGNGASFALKPSAL